MNTIQLNKYIIKKIKQSKRLIYIQQIKRYFLCLQKIDQEQCQMIFSSHSALKQS